MTESAIMIRKLNKSYNERIVFEDYSIDIKKGERLLFLIPSGLGKTTLFNMICGIVQPDSGEILLADDSKIHMVFQEDRLIMHQSAFGNLDIFRTKLDKQLADDILTRLGLGESCDLPVSDFSGGMKRRVAIARALYSMCTQKDSSPILIMDEPFKGLDYDNKLNTAAFIDELLRKYNGTLLISSHEPDDMSLLKCNRHFTQF